MPRVGGSGGGPSGNAGGVLNGTYPNPSFAADMATQAELDAKRLDQVAAPTADVSLNSQKIIGLASPTAATEAANKAYVDAIAAGFDVKMSVRVSTTANIALSGTQTIDGVSVIATNRVLVKNQTAASENGIYVCAAGAWSRSADADTDAEVTSGLFTFVEEGTVNADQGWALATNNPITLGSTALSFTQVSGVGGSPTGAAGGVLAGTYPNPTFASDMATQAELDAHVNDAADAHDASAISILDAANDFAATDVEAALAELQAADEADEAALASHISDASAAHDASAIAFTPNGSIAAATVQLAIQEVRDEASAGAAVTDQTISTTDNTVNNASTTKHGWLAKLNNNRSYYMGGKGEWNALGPATEWFVDVNASAGGDGKSFSGAKTTFAAVVAAGLQPHDIVHICSNLNEHINISVQKVRVVGVGLPIIASSSTTIADRVVTISARDVTLENVQIRGHAGFKGVLLMLDHAQEYCLRNVYIDGTVSAATATFYPTSSAAGTGIGGIGVAIHNADGGYMEHIDIRNCSIGWAGGTWSTRAMVNKLNCTQNAQDIVVGLATGAYASAAQTTAFGYGQSGTGANAQSGSNHFTDVILASAVSASYTTPPSLDLIGDNSADCSVEVSGRNVFVNLDAQENFAQARLRFGAIQTTLVNFTTAAGTQAVFAGRHSNVTNGYILGPTWSVTSAFNTFTNIVAANGGLQFTGGFNILEQAYFSAGAPLSGAGNDGVFRNVHMGAAAVPALTGIGNQFHNTYFPATTVLSNLGTGPSVIGGNGVKQLTYGTTIATDVRLASVFPITATDTVAYTISNPTDTYNGTSSTILTVRPITYDILNSSGGTMGDITWGSKFVLQTTITKPANGKHLLIDFYYNATLDKWIEKGRVLHV